MTTLSHARIYFDYAGGYLAQYEGASYTDRAYGTGFASGGVLHVRVNFTNNTIAFGADNLFGPEIALSATAGGAYVLFATSPSPDSNAMQVRMRTQASRFLTTILEPGETAWDDGSVAVV